MMEDDYYKTLRVEPTADFDTIKKAFRERVMKCHPDRGGSHAEMVQVNLAWEVLSNPQLRQRYDEARTHAGNRAAQEASAADAREARQRAEQYPRRWEEFEKWLNGVAGDFARAEYGSVQLGRAMWLRDIYLPTVGNSFSGWLFILIGAVLGGVFLIPVVYGFVEKNLIDFNRTWNVYKLRSLALVVAPVIGGAWVGARIHRWMSDEIKKAQKQSAWRTQSEQERSAASESRIVSCEKCGQKLRVPCIQSELLVTCGSCGHKFSYPPS